MTCRPEKRARPGESGRSRAPLRWRRRRQRVRAAKREGSRKSSCALPSSRQGAVRRHSARSRRRAVKHGAAGGWMTARWSGVCPEQRTSALFRGGSRRRTPAGFPTALGGKSPERVFLLRVLVTRNVGCRSGFEASRRCLQGKAARPYKACVAQRQEGERPGRGRSSFTSRKGATARGGRKTDAALDDSACE